MGNKTIRNQRFWRGKTRRPKKVIRDNYHRERFNFSEERDLRYASAKRVHPGTVKYSDGGDGTGKIWVVAWPMTLNKP